MEESFYKQFANDWINDWNSHDLDKIMSHYADDLEFFSPMISKLGINNFNRITRKTVLRDYFKTGLEKYPDLHFKLHHVFVGAHSIVIYFTGVNNQPVAEFTRFDSNGKINLVNAHYAITS